MNLYAILDTILGEFGPLLEQKHDAVALRTFQVTMADRPNAGDFRLFFVGEFDRETGAGSMGPVREIFASPDLQGVGDAESR